MKPTTKEIKEDHIRGEWQDLVDDNRPYSGTCERGHTIQVTKEETQQIKVCPICANKLEWEKL